MIELRQLMSYVFGLVVAAVTLLGASSYAVLEAVQYVPEADASAKSQPVLAAAEVEIDRDARPVWIAPTAKYSYDPSLMVVKPREQRLKEAEAKRQLEAARYVAKQRAEKAQRIAQQRLKQRSREQGTAYAYQSEERQTFSLFSLFQ